MKKKKQIHPAPSETALDILNMYQEKPSDSIEIRSMELICGNNNLSSKYINLKAKQEMYTTEIKRYQKMLDEVNEDINKIERTIENNQVGESENLSEAIGVATRILGKINFELENTNNYGIKKATLDDIDAIAKQYHVPLETLLKKLDKNLMKNTLKNYDKII